MGKLQRKLVAAGYRSKEAMPVFIGLRVGVSLLLFFVVSFPIFHINVLVAIGAAAIGYLLTTMALGRMAQRRQHRIRLSLPDALDLLVVSVEAGLGLDQALQRVGDELAFAHQRPVCDELRLVNLELRAGKAHARKRCTTWPSARALTTLSSLVAMLDADRQVRHERGAVAARATPRRCAPSAGSGPKRPRRRRA